MNSSIKPCPGSLMTNSIVILICIAFAAPAGIQKGKTNFWTNLEAGKSQRIDFVGGCITGMYGGNWVDTVAKQLNRKFGNRVSYRNINTIQNASNFLVTPDVQSQLAADKPNIIVFEVAEWDADPRYNCDVNRCAMLNWKQAIEWTRWKIPGCEIVFWIPWPTINAPHYRLREVYTNAARQLAADSSLFLVDTYWKMLGIYKADPSPTCYALNGADSGQNCPLYTQYLPDGVHVRGDAAAASWLVVDSIIAPAMMATFSGLANWDATGPSSAPANVHATLIGDKGINLAWDSVAQSSAPNSGVCGYNVYRNGSLVSQQNPVTFKDSHLQELTTYSYVISAYNASLAEGAKSAAIQVTTHADLTPPKIVDVRASLADTVITILFDEPLDQAAAVNASNYSINKNITIRFASLLSNKAVRLSTSALIEGTYTLTINGIKDLSAAKNAVSASKAFAVAPLASGLAYDYYLQQYPGWRFWGDTQSAMGTINDSGILPNINLNDQSSIAPNVDFCQFIFKGIINIPVDGNYVFYSQSSTCCLFYLDTIPIIIDNNAGQVVSYSPLLYQERFARSYLKAGRYPFTLDFFKRFQASFNLKLSYEGPGIAKQLVPENMFYHYAPPDTTPSFMTILQPIDGATYKIGDTLPVTWVLNDKNVLSLVFSISFDGGKTFSDMFTKGIPSDTAHFDWIIPSFMPTGSPVSTQAIIAAADYNNLGNIVQSGLFTIAKSSSSNSGRFAAPQAGIGITLYNKTIKINSLGICSDRAVLAKPNGAIVASRSFAGSSSTLLSCAQVPSGAYIIILYGQNNRILTKPIFIHK